MIDYRCLQKGACKPCNLKKVVDNVHRSGIGYLGGVPVASVTVGTHTTLQSTNFPFSSLLLDTTSSGYKLVIISGNVYKRKTREIK